MPAMPATIYLDCNSTAPLDPQVAEAMLRCWRDGLANPASQHYAGRKARRVVEESREGIAVILGAHVTGMEADRLVFTSGGTEANNLALFGLGSQISMPARLIISAIEHPSITVAAEVLAQRGIDVQRLPVNIDGVVQIERLVEMLGEGAEKRTRLVSVMLANNETGVLQPVAEIAALCREFDVPVHTDAVQAVGKLPVNFRELGVTALTLTAHKFHGPLGIGALLVRHDAVLEPQLFGGFQQAGLRPGTESAALAVGFHTALVLWQREAAEREQRMTSLRDLLAAALHASAPDCVLIGERSDRLPQTLNVAFPGVNRQALVMALDLAGVACSTGSACASGSSEPSPVLLAMGLLPEIVESSIRLSFGAATTAAEITSAAGRILKCVQHLRQQETRGKTAVVPRQSARNTL